MINNLAHTDDPRHRAALALALLAAIGTLTPDQLQHAALMVSTTHGLLSLFSADKGPHDPA